jgi:hypothetical protein
MILGIKFCSAMGHKPPMVICILAIQGIQTDKSQLLSDQILIYAYFIDINQFRNKTLLIH